MIKIKEIIQQKLPGVLWASIIGSLAYLLAIVWKELSLPVAQKLLPELSKTGLLAIILSQFLVLIISFAYILLSRNKRRNYRFDKKLGIYFHKKTNDPFCPSCLVPDNIESPLHEAKNGWYCQRTACDKFFNNPDFEETPRPPINWKTA